MLGGESHVYRLQRPQQPQDSFSTVSLSIATVVMLTENTATACYCGGIEHRITID